MCLRFVFLLVTRLAAWSRLRRRADSGKDAEILLLRHQLTVLRRQPGPQPRPSWADRALIAALLSIIPRARTPPGRPATRRNIRSLVLRLAVREPGVGLPPDPRRAGRTGHPPRTLDRVGDPEEGRDQTGAGPARPGLSSCAPRLAPSSPLTSSPSAAGELASPNLTVYTAQPGSASEDALRLLASWALTLPSGTGTIASEHAPVDG
ncbi:MAG TPA: hypothetical protein VMV07_01755 [Streptosporangiaceae bacterium]|nr:hypothetical protein [Streptosporangiaceae bacterium]